MVPNKANQPRLTRCQMNPSWPAVGRPWRGGLGTCPRRRRCHPPPPQSRPRHPFAYIKRK